MELYFKCSNKDFNRIDLFFAEQSYDKKPEFDFIILETEHREFHYSVKEEFGTYYIVAD